MRNKSRFGSAMTREKAQKILNARDQLFALQDKMLKLGGLTRNTWNSQWVTPSGNLLWQDDALRVVEHDAMIALGKDPGDRRMP